MNILFWTHALGGGGTERVVCRLSAMMAEQGHRVYVAAISEKEPSYQWDKRVKVIFAGGDRRRVMERRIHSIGYIRRLLNKKHIDLIACFIVNTIPFAMLGCIGSGSRPKIIGVERMNPKDRSRLQHMALLPFILRCDGFVFQTNGSKKCYPKVVQRKSTVIANMVPEITEEDTDERRTIPHSIVSAGRLHRDKDYETVLRALRRIIRIVPDASLFIYGDGPNKTMLETYAEELGVREHVHFEGLRDDVIKLLKSYDVFLFSSRSEGMPNALLEAMAVGMPCVSTACEFGPAELIRDGVNGFLVPTGDEKKMADRVSELLLNPKKRNSMARKAKEICKRYAPEAIVKMYDDYFQMIAG